MPKRSFAVVGASYRHYVSRRCRLGISGLFCRALLLYLFFIHGGKNTPLCPEFGKRSAFHDWMSWISAVRYNFLHSHRSLRRRMPNGRWEHRTPAMAAGLADPIYSTLELLRLCPVGLG